ncbi:CYTH domain protein [Mycobacterium ulcerans str. Harvey]|uniref:CYTH domain protein n=1 Tax=Mycobacterium ulcerans str. Harvey TaxID=1299332 RepID=A0ABP3AJE0_MYCUL|nr:CYTH domain protein [Mycobacterium ulcerans str. Harvey]
MERKPVQALDAVYFDTADQDLASNRITLRRRTGGSDAGWHLKLPAGGDARTELHAPITEPDTSGSLGAPTQHRVPAELLDVVLAIVRDRPLQPVARINTQRASQFLYGVDGAPLAEFCDDHVTAWSAGAGPDAEPAQQQWREWELELSDPSQSASRELLDRLSNRLLDTGAAPAGHDSKLARVLGSTSPWAGRPEPADPVHRAVARYVAELLVWDRAVRTDVDDSVHQMRVTTRKIRSLLADSQDSFGLADKAWVLDELRELAAVLGVARDAEVLGQRYQHALERLDPTLVRGPVYERLVDGARHRYHAGLRRSLVAMRSKRYFRLLDALDAIAAAYPADTAAAGLSRPHPEYRGGLPTGPQGRQTRQGGRQGAKFAGRVCRRGRGCPPRPQRGAAPNPQARQEAALHRRGHRSRPGLQPGQGHPDAARRSPGQRGQPRAPAPRDRCGARRGPGHLYLRSAVSAGERSGRGLPAAARRRPAPARQVGTQDPTLSAGGQVKRHPTRSIQGSDEQSEGQ